MFSSDSNSGAKGSLENLPKVDYLRGTPQIKVKLQRAALAVQVNEKQRCHTEGTANSCFAYIHQGIKIVVYVRRASVNAISR